MFAINNCKSEYLQAGIPIYKHKKENIYYDRKREKMVFIERKYGGKCMLK